MEKMALSKKDKSMIAQAYRLIISCILSVNSRSDEIFEKFKDANEQFEDTIEKWLCEEEDE